VDCPEGVTWLEAWVRDIPNLIVTPHVGFFSDQAFAQQRRDAASAVMAFLGAESPSSRGSRGAGAGAGAGGSKGKGRNQQKFGGFGSGGGGMGGTSLVLGGDNDDDDGEGEEEEGGEGAGTDGEDSGGRGLHSSTVQLNLSRV